MTWPAALPVAALRTLRTAAGRRALQVVLLVGGLFALGFLCGEQAHAADGTLVGTGTSSTSSSSVSAPTASAGAVPSAPEGGGIDDSGAATRSVLERSMSEPAGLADPATPGVQAPAQPGDAPAAPVTPADPRPQAPGAQDPHPTPGAPGTDGADGQTLLPVTERVIQGARERVVEPVGDLVESVADGLAQAPPLSSFPSPSLPAWPSAPESPSWPSWPGEIPGMPGIPSRPSLPGLPGKTLPAPVTATPQPASPAPAPGDGRGGEGRTGDTGTPSTPGVPGVSGKEATAAYGPRFAADAAALRASAPADAHRTTPSGSAPAHQAPAGHPGGVLGNHSAGDSGSSRHGDAHAVSLTQRAPLRLIPGVAVRADADGIQDRHRDIPVSPA